jgi:hypothetical protein
MLLPLAPFFTEVILKVAVGYLISSNSETTNQILIFVIF